MDKLPYHNIFIRIKLVTKQVLSNNEIKIEPNIYLELIQSNLYNPKTMTDFSFKNKLSISLKYKKSEML